MADGEITKRGVRQLRELQKANLKTKNDGRGLLVVLKKIAHKLRPERGAANSQASVKDSELRRGGEGTNTDEKGCL